MWILGSSGSYVSLKYCYLLCKLGWSWIFSSVHPYLAATFLLIFPISPNLLMCLWWDSELWAIHLCHLDPPSPILWLESLRTNIAIFLKSCNVKLDDLMQRSEKLLQQLTFKQTSCLLLYEPLRKWTWSTRDIANCDRDTFQTAIVASILTPLDWTDPLGSETGW